MTLAEVRRSPRGRVMAGRHVLMIDTATHQAMIALGRVSDGHSRVLAVSRRDVGHRHGSHLPEQLDEVLDSAGLGLADLDAIAVGTGPGSFTGLRVGMATAKTLAYVRGLPLLGIPSAEALARAVVGDLVPGRPATVTVVLPAGAHDHYVARLGGSAELVPPGGLEVALEGDPTVMTIGMATHRLGEEAHRLGRGALEGLPRSMLEMAMERLEAGLEDDPVALVPGYVALPRGISSGQSGEAWSPDLR